MGLSVNGSLAKWDSYIILSINGIRVTPSTQQQRALVAGSDACDWHSLSSVPSRSTRSVAWLAPHAFGVSAPAASRYLIGRRRCCLSCLANRKMIMAQSGVRSSGIFDCTGMFSNVPESSNCSESAFRDRSKPLFLSDMSLHFPILPHLKHALSDAHH